jgi:hypothetical protein
MSIYLRLLSGEILTFSIFDGYKFSNLRSEFYDIMSEQLDITELECIFIFDNNDEYNFQVDLTDMVTEGKMYSVFVNKVAVRLVFDKKFRRVNFEHDYQQFPQNTIIQITSLVQENHNEIYKNMYNILSNCFQEDIDSFNNDPDDNFWRDNLFQTFREHINQNYSHNYDLNLEELIQEYIKRFICINIKVEEFIYM